jgi:hypothetical protein
MKKLKKLTLMALKQEMPELTVFEQREIVGGTSVSIVMTRYGYGGTSTISYFTATAYNDSGFAINVVQGFMLEPGFDSSQCATSGSGTAICTGTYTITKRIDGAYALNGVNGRSGILIHTGNTSGDTLGCLIPGDSVGYANSNYYIPYGSSTPMTNDLFSLLDTYGSGGMEIIIN